MTRENPMTALATGDDDQIKIEHEEGCADGAGWYKHRMV